MKTINALRGTVDRRESREAGWKRAGRLLEMALAQLETAVAQLTGAMGLMLLLTVGLPAAGQPADGLKTKGSQEGTANRTEVLMAEGGGREEGEQIRIVFWNVENFFDYKDGGTGESDTEFSAHGERRWTRKRFLAKCRAIAKALLWIADGYGGLADIVGLAEVENGFVLQNLLSQTALRRCGYAVVHFDSPDPRGIDVALLYRRERLRLVEARPLPVEGLQTRDILQCGFVGRGGDSLAVLVCHLPSKYGGAGTASRRVVALQRLKAAADSLRGAGWSRMVLTGDFNEEASDPLFDVMEPDYENLGRNCRQGSIRFDGSWQLIDNAFVPSGAFTGVHFAPVRIPFLIARDSAHAGEKPFRTYSGPQYIGGVSDHLPVYILLKR